MATSKGSSTNVIFATPTLLSIMIMMLHNHRYRTNDDAPNKGIYQTKGECKNEESTIKNVGRKKRRNGRHSQILA
ncbi:hypothetical protein [Bacillus sp. FSL K6-3431]|uniref:hypothetical protein n=1 Tax=Bacillus sp. FSL K6-3431 TaxID=2921500 RepID=UPI0030FC9927